MSFISKAEYKLLLHHYDHGESYEECASISKIFQSLKIKDWNSPKLKTSDFIITVNNNIPRFSWLCEVENTSFKFIIGSGVEYDQNAKFIVEGVWDGNFLTPNFGDSDYFYGSGAYLNTNNTCVFVPPRHCTDFLYVLYDKLNKKYFVSNTFNFILKRAHVAQSSDFYSLFKENIHKSSNAESSLGADRGSPIIADTSEYVMYRMMYHNFCLGTNGGIHYLPAIPKNLKINNFMDYQTLLLQTTSRILANGSDKARKTPLGAVTMLSTGYDSVAVSSICKQAGVTDAVTLDVVTTGHNDCGDKIAEALDLNCHKVESPLGKIVPNLRGTIDGSNKNFLEFMATHGIGDNIAFCNMEEHFAGKMVFSGLYGDGVWSLEGNGGGLAHHLPYMKSRNEFRLRTGYALVPLPAFGAYFPYPFIKLLLNCMACLKCPLIA